ncbi:hypothetical protein B0T20DRAFT_395735 [Sordaria brevicollis]|uniref:Uncharacterized protein n=1 Tax=Sordaria brevicollis TaxID=83679 RepID=A0AAE0P9G7_SORBR|nr:hypothetical protein B0T20DRAFT_395735 [Sordaria brevicollis]
MGQGLGQPGKSGAGRQGPTLVPPVSILFCAIAAASVRAGANSRRVPGFTGQNTKNTIFKLGMVSVSPLPLQLRKLFISKGPISDRIWPSARYSYHIVSKTLYSQQFITTRRISRARNQANRFSPSLPWMNTLRSDPRQLALEFLQWFAAVPVVHVQWWP